jgi:branched-chain amino acid transport system ATP-binding protein
MLEVRNLSVWYGVTEVLRDVSFKVPAGQIVGLLGGNGAGKTTLLNTLSGLLQPRGGEITVEGRSIRGLPPYEIVRSGVAQVPQGRFVWPHMSVKDNIELGAITRRDREGIREDVENVYQLFPVLLERRNAKAGALSGGQQQMLAIARALMSRPRLLLMDEPSHGLSPKIVEEMVETVRLLHQRGMTVVLVEQNVGVAAALAEQAYVLRNGIVALSLPGDELLGNPDLLRNYLGR